MADTTVSSRITENPKYSTYFSDCLGTLDGTHIDIQVLPPDQSRYQNRKSHLTQNILAVCDFKMQFKYILVGQEGSVHNTAV